MQAQHSRSDGWFRDALSGGPAAGPPPRPHAARPAPSDPLRLPEVAPLKVTGALRYDGTGLRALRALATAGHGPVPLPRRIAEAGAGAPRGRETDRRGRCARRTPHGRIPV
ncbi:hypothetical protein ABZ766_30320 [Streptomyces sp. NPDC006670]|uniref:hypothetical protein n=1 Tax=Streptomyces sp. NPDC006670 TaxID=3154476 RepID=UPI00340A8D48